MTYVLPFLAVLLGFAVVSLFKLSSQWYIKLLLSFSGAFLLALTVFVLIPEVYHHEEHTHNFKHIGLFIIIGVLLQIVLEFFSHGAEHGHSQHTVAHQHTVFPLSLFISLSIHSILEGFPLSHAHNQNLVYGIFMNSGVGKWKTAFFLLFFALMTPLGTFLSANVPQLGAYHTELSGVVIGIFLHISTVILFENAEGHRFNLLKFLTVFIGFAVGYLS